MKQLDQKKKKKKHVLNIFKAFITIPKSREKFHKCGKVLPM